MTKKPTLYILLALVLTLQAATVNSQIAQPCQGPQDPSLSGCNFCVNCNMASFSGDNFNTYSAYPNQVLCGQMTLQSDQWFGFVAGSESIGVSLNQFDCYFGDGMQLAFVEDCGGLTLACNPSYAGGAWNPVLTLEYDHFVPGQSYYLVIDGWSGDHCAYNLDVVDGSMQPMPLDSATQVIGPNKVCPGATVNYSVPPVQNAGYYEWSAPYGASINGAGDHLIVPGAVGANVQISFGNPGGQVCVKAGNSCQDPLNEVCLNVTNQPIPPTFLPDLVVPYWEQPYLWSVDGSYIAPFGNILASATLSSALGCDSMVLQKIFQLPEYPQGAAGIIYLDSNNNGIRDANEPLYTAGTTVKTSNGQSTTNTNYGYFIFPVIQNGASVYILPPSPDAIIHPASYVMHQGDSVLYAFGIYFPPAPPVTTEGLVYNDSNNNGVQDAGEGPLSGVMLQSSGGLIASTGADGHFQFPTFVVGDTLRVIPPGPTAVVHPAFQVVTAGNASGYNFGVYTPVQNFDLSVDLTNVSVFHQGFTTEVTITVHNNSSTPTANCKVGLSMPYYIDYAGAVPAASVYSDSLGWQLGTMAAGETRVITVKLLTIAGTPNNRPVNLNAYVVPLAGDAQPGNNVDKIHTLTVGPYDPNEKSVDPAFVTPDMLAGSDGFEYTIRFQNTGNYPATFVRIIDTLGAGVDPAGFRFISSSHPCSWSVSGTGIVKFYFDAILLPDSTADEPGSHGFVKFSVPPQPGLQLGQTVLNFSDIYFDFNEPVRTNTAGTEVVYFLPGSIPPGGDNMKARPNPATWIQQFGWLTPTPAAGNLRYFDLLGISRLNLDVPSGVTSAMADVAQLPVGLYLVVLDAGSLHLSKLVSVFRGGIGQGQF